MKKDFEYAVVIGRFQPFHRAHLEILKVALALGEKVIIILGSHCRAPDPRNPFSSAERQELILETIDAEDRARVQFLPLSDYDYNEDVWLVEAQQKVSELTEDSESVCLVGHKSDLTSYYLDSFPEWKFIDYTPNHPIHATKIRDLYFTHDKNYTEFLHKNVVGWMDNFKKTPKFAYLKDYFDEVRNYHEMFRGSPFPLTFNTVDTVVRKSGHILVVRRKGRIGRGLIALPGGFIDQNETLVQSAIRELKEETAIAVSKENLYNAIITQKPFDEPRRSLRGRVITEAFFLNLGSGQLPKVKGSDDAEKAFWMSLRDIYLNQDQFFEDHWHIIFYFTHSGFDNPYKRIPQDAILPERKNVNNSNNKHTESVQ